MASLGAHWLTSRVKSSAVRDHIDGTLFTTHPTPGARWIAWPHLEPRQQLPGRGMRKSQPHRSHSWWWDSHICPRNSRWLSENLSEMDSKLNAMLHIIEEDADSFAERAEMYYKRRPELINLVEGFYRTYRSLVERYNFLTREIRQNLAPALQAQLGISGESVENSPIDLQMKNGPEGFDVISLSRSFTEDSEFDEEDQIEVSSRKLKVPLEEQETASADLGVNVDVGFAGSMHSEPVLEGEDRYGFQEETRAGNAAELDMHRLEEELQHLKEENKTLTLKSSEEIASLKKIQFELQSKIKKLDADDKVAKSRLQVALDQSVKLDAENLKLNRALILLKEEKRELNELWKRDEESNRTATCKVEDLQMQLSLMKEEILKACLEASSRAEQVEILSKERQTLLHALSNLQEEVTTLEKAVHNQKETFEEQLKEFQERLSSLYQENSTLKDQMACEVEHVKTLNVQLAELQNIRLDLEKELCCLHEQIQILESEKLESIPTILNLQQELQTATKESQDVHDEMELKMQHSLKLEGDIYQLKLRLNELQNQQVMENKLVQMLQVQIQEFKAERENLVDKCEIYIGSCQDFELTVADLKEQIASKTCEAIMLQEKLSATEVAVTKSESKVEDLQQNLCELDKEKLLLFQELEKAKYDNERHIYEAHTILGNLTCAEKKLKDACTELDYLRENKLKLEKELLDSTMTCNEFKEKLSTMQGEKDQLSKCLFSQTCMAILREEEIIALDEENREMLCKSKLEGDKLQKLEAENINLQQILKLSQEENSISLEKIKRLIADKSILEDEWTRAHNGLLLVQKENNHYQLDILEGVTRIKKLEEDNAQLNEAKRILEADITLQLKQFSMLEKTVMKLQVQKDKLELDLQSMLKRTEVWEKENDGLQHAVANLQQERRTIECEFLKAAEDSKKIDEVLLDANKEFTSLKSKNEELNVEIATTVKAMERLKEALGMLHEEKRCLENEIIFSLANMNALQQEVNRLKTENKGLHLQIHLESQQKERKTLQMEKLSGHIANVEIEKESLTRDMLKLKETLAKFDEERKILENEIFSGHTNIDALQHDIIGLRNKNKDLHLQLCSGSDQLERKEMQIQNLLAHVADVEGKHKSMLEDVQTLKVALSEALEERNILQNDVLSSLSKMDALKLEVNGLKSDNKKLHLHVNSALEELEIKGTEVQKLSEFMDTLQQEFPGLKNENESLCLQVSSESGHLARKDLELLGHIEDSESQKKSVIENLQNLKKALAELHKERITLENEMLSARANVDALQQEIRILKGENEDLHLQICSVSKLLEVKDMDIQKLLGHIMDVECKREASLKDLLKVEEAHAKLHEERKALESEIFCGLESMSSLQQEVNRLKDESKDLQLQINSELQQLEMKDMELQKLLGHIEIVESEKKSVQEDLEKLKELHTELHEEKIACENEIFAGLVNMGALQDEVNRLKDENKSLHLQISSESKQLEMKDTQIKELSIHIGDAEIEKKSVLLDLHKLKERLVELHEERKTLETDIMSVVANINALQQDIIGLKNENNDLHLQISSRSEELERKEMHIHKLLGHIADILGEKESIHEYLLNLKEELADLQKENETLFSFSNMDSLQQSGNILKNGSEDSHLQIITGLEQLEIKDMKIHKPLPVDIEIDKKSVLDLQKLKGVLAELHDEKNLENEILSGIANTEVAQQEVKSLKNKIQNSHSEISSVSDQMEKKSTEIQKLLGTIADIYSEKMSVLEDLQKLRHNYALEQLQEEFFALKLDHMQRKHEFSDQLDHNKCLEGELQKLKIAALLDRTSMDEKQLTKLLEEVVELQEKEKKLLLNLEGKRSKDDKLVNEIGRLQQCLLPLDEHTIVSGTKVMKIVHDDNIAISDLQDQLCLLQEGETKLKTQVATGVSLDDTLQEVLSNSENKRKAFCNEAFSQEEVIAKLLKEADSLSEENGGLNKNIKASKAEIAHSKIDIRKLMDVAILRLKETNALMELKHKTLEEEYQSQGEQKHLFENHVRDIVSKLYNMMEENSVLKGQVKSHSNTLKRLEDALSTVNFENIKSKLKLQEGKAYELHKTLIKEKEMNEQLTRRVHAKETDKLKALFSKLKAELLFLREELKLKKLDSADSASYIHKLEEDLSHMKVEHELLKVTLEKKINEYNNLELEVLMLQDTLSTSQQNNVMLQDEAASCRAQLNTLEALISRQQEEATRREIETNSLREELSTSTCEVHKLRDDLFCIEEENQRIKNTLGLVNGPLLVSSVEAKLSSLQETSENLKHQIESGSGRICELEAERVTLIEEGSRLTTRVLSQEEEIMDFQDMLMSFHEEAKRLSDLLERNLLMVKEDVKTVMEEWQKNMGTHGTDIKDWTGYLVQEDSGESHLDLKTMVNSYDCMTSPQDQNKNIEETVHTNYMRSFHGERHTLKEKRTCWSCKLQSQIQEVDVLRKAINHAIYFVLKTKASQSSIINETNEVQEVDALSKLHISLSVQIHREEMIDKLQQQACEVKKRRTKLKEGLRNLEIEVEKMQNIVKEGLEKESLRKLYDEEIDAMRVMLLRSGNYVKSEEESWKIVEEQVLRWEIDDIASMMEGWDDEKVIELGEKLERIVEGNKKCEMEVEEVDRRIRVLKKKDEERSELEREREREKEDVSSLQKWILKPRFLWLTFKSPISKGQPKKLMLTEQDNRIFIQQIKTKRGMNCWACVRTPSVH